MSYISTFYCVFFILRLITVCEEAKPANSLHNKNKCLTDVVFIRSPTQLSGMSFPPNQRLLLSNPEHGSKTALAFND